MNRERAQRFCIDCSYPLIEMGRRPCPECGREYDTGNPTTTTTFPLEAARKTARTSSLVATTLLALLLLFVTVECAMGADPLMFGAVLGVLGTPIVLILLILPASARATSRLAWLPQLAIAIGLVAATAVTLVTNWPVRIQFALFQDQFDALADVFEAGGPVSSRRIGVLRVGGAYSYDPGVAQIWIRRPAGALGAIEFMRCPAKFETWGAVYWEITLSENWRAIAED